MPSSYPFVLERASLPTCATAYSLQPTAHSNNIMSDLKYSTITYNKKYNTITPKAPIRKI